MSYILKELPASPKNHGSVRTAGQIRYLVLHYTGNDGDSAASNAAHFQNNVVKASAHYFVDDTTVYRSVADLRAAWAVGGGMYSGAAAIGGAAMFDIINNTNSISVELCGTKKDGTCQPSEATLENAVLLCRKLMNEYHIPLSNVYRHFDVTGKLCPAYFVEESAWTAFKARLGKELSMTQMEFDTLMKDWLARNGEVPPSAGSEEARQWAEENGMIVGYPDGSKRYKSFCTREQAALLLHRFWKAFLA